MISQYAENIYTSTSSPTPLTSSTQSSITASTTPIPDDTIPLLLDVLISSTNYLRAQIKEFPGNKALVATYLTQSDYIIASINQLRSEIPKTTLEQVSFVAKTLQSLKDEYETLLEKNRGNEQATIKYF